MVAVCHGSFSNSNECIPRIGLKIERGVSVQVCGGKKTIVPVPGCDRALYAGVKRVHHKIRECLWGRGQYTVW
ncbi:hypothetical protein Gaha_0064_018 [Novacetimonas hansenii JCM 7643]|nr:hypothetical protein Gaha_0064_018 [Novacetimonas hansenii JCM 7643]GBQ61576.1 hypothetical protein AA0243_2694 [Novacetimonas hansenii NRIC 0243]